MQLRVVEWVQVVYETYRGGSFINWSRLRTASWSPRITHSFLKVCQDKNSIFRHFFKSEPIYSILTNLQTHVSCSKSYSFPTIHAKYTVHSRNLHNTRDKDNCNVWTRSNQFWNRARPLSEQAARCGMSANRRLFCASILQKFPSNRSHLYS